MQASLRMASGGRSRYFLAFTPQFLVVAKLECALVAEGAGTVGALAAVTFPAIGDAAEHIFSCQATHHAQLHDMQLMIERTGDHRQARSGLLVEGPEAQIVAIKIVQQSSNPAGEKFLRRGVAGC